MGYSKQSILGIGIALMGFLMIIFSSEIMIGGFLSILGAFLTASPSFKHPKELIDKIDIPVSWMLLGTLVGLIVWKQRGIDFFLKETLSWLFGIILFSTLGLSIMRLIFGKKD